MKLKSLTSKITGVLTPTKPLFCDDDWLDSCLEDDWWDSDFEDDDWDTELELSETNPPLLTPDVTVPPGI